MLIIKAKINDVYKSIDTFENPSAELTYEIKDIIEISKRKNTWSKTIELPGTKANNEFFEYAYNVNITSRYFKPNKRVSCVVAEDTVTILDGFLQLTNIKINNQSEVSYEVVLFGSLIDFAKSLGEKLLTNNTDALNNLTFPEIETSIYATGTPSNMDDTWAGNSDTTGIIYPLADYSYGWTKSLMSSTTVFNPKFNQTGLFASIYVKRVWDKIFGKAGFTYSSAFLTSDLFKSLFILNPNTNPTELNNVIVEANRGSIAATTANNVFTDVTIPFNPVTFNPTGAFTGSVYYVSSPGVYVINTRLTYTSVATFNGIVGRILLKIHRASGAVNLAYFGTPSMPGNGLLQTNKTNAGVVLSANVQLYTGDTIELILHCGTTPGSSITIPTNLATNTLSISSDRRVVTSSDLLPKNMKQIDFITSLVRMFNLYIEPDKNNPKNLIIEPRDVYYASGAIKDWSMKLDSASGYEITMLSDEASKIYKFSHKQNDDYLSENYRNKTGFNYGDASVEIDNDFASNEYEVKSEFGATLIEKVEGFEDVYVPKLYKYDGVSKFSTYDLPRILVNNGPTTIDAPVYINGTDYYSIPLVSEFSDILGDECRSILFGESTNPLTGSITPGLFETYYQNEIDAVSNPDGKKLKAKFLLSTNDIAGMRFNDKIFLVIENNPSYWRIQKITYAAGLDELTEVELIKIDDLQNPTRVVTRYNGVGSGTNVSVENTVGIVKETDLDARDYANNTDLTNGLNGKVAKTGDVMSGNLAFNGGSGAGFEFQSISTPNQYFGVATLDGSGSITITNSNYDNTNTALFITPQSAPAGTIYSEYAGSPNNFSIVSTSGAIDAGLKVAWMLIKYS